MKKHTLYRILGILVLVLPFLGLYQYMKDVLYIVVGLVLILTATQKAPRKSSEGHSSKKEAERHSSIAPQPIMRKEIEVPVSNE